MTTELHRVHPTRRCPAKRLTALALAAMLCGCAGLNDEAGDDARLGDDRVALIEELRAERQAASKAAAEAAQESEAQAWLEAKRAAEAAEAAGGSEA